MHNQAFLVSRHCILQGHEQHSRAAEASGDHRGCSAVSLDIAVLVLRLSFGLSICSMCVTSVCHYMTSCRLAVEDWWVFLLQNSNLSVEEGKMRENWSSVNWCNTGFKKRPYLFYIPFQLFYWEWQGLVWSVVGFCSLGIRKDKFWEQQETILPSC